MKKLSLEVLYCILYTLGNSWDEHHGQAPLKPCSIFYSPGQGFTSDALWCGKPGMRPMLGRRIAAPSLHLTYHTLPDTLYAGFHLRPAIIPHPHSPALPDMARLDGRLGITSIVGDLGHLVL